MRYGWKRISDGAIVQGATAASPGELFEAAGFGAVGVDSPIKGMLAVKVHREDGRLVERRTPDPSAGGERKE